MGQRQGGPALEKPAPLSAVHQLSFDDLICRGGSGGEGGPDVAGMNDDQLYSLIMAMNPPPQASIPAGAVPDAHRHIALADTTALCASPSAAHLIAGATERQAPMSVEEAKRAIQSAKTAIGAKGTPRSEQVIRYPSK